MKNQARMLIMAAALVAMATPAGATTFRWAVEKDVTYKIVSYVREERYVNSAYHSTVEIRNKALLQCTAVESNKALYQGDFYYYERDAAATNRPFELRQVYPTKFWRDDRGRFTIGLDQFMPVVRHVPTFPEEDIQPGHIWRAPAEEVHDLKAYGMDSTYKIPIDVRYIYVGDDVINGRKVAKFSFTYVISHQGNVDPEKFLKDANQFLLRYRDNPALFQRYKKALQEKLEGMRRAPKRILGAAIQLYYWDVEARLPFSFQEEFHFVFHLGNGDVHEYKGTSRAEFEKVVPLDVKEKDKLVDSLKKRQFDGLKVAKDKRGVVLNFADLLFDFDKATIRPEVREKLARVAEVLRKHKTKDIRVEGHSDDVGDPEYNLLLSQKRAAAVAELLGRLAGIDPRRISWIGHGKSKPVADNRTLAGKAANRRVEVIILTEE